MEKEQQFLRIDKQNELNKILKLNEKEIKIYLYICSRMTFNQDIFGVFSKKSLSSIANSLEFENIQVKRSLKKLEKESLLYVVNQNENLILSKNQINIDELKLIIEQNYFDFNLRPERLKELKEFFNWQIDFKAIYAKKPPQAIKVSTNQEKLIVEDFDKDCPF